MVDWWKQWKPANLPQECEFATDGYAVCPKCKTNDNTDNTGEDDLLADGTKESHWQCEDCCVLFSVYDEHPNYKKTWREDHYDFYYVLKNWETYDDDSEVEYGDTVYFGFDDDDQ